MFSITAEWRHWKRGTNSVSVAYKPVREEATDVRLSSSVYHRFVLLFMVSGTAVQSLRYACQICAEGDMPALIETVPGFTKHIRVFIVHTLASTFQAVKRLSMEQCLDLVSLLDRNAWRR